jgi:hypothetical protein
VAVTQPYANGAAAFFAFDISGRRSAIPKHAVHHVSKALRTAAEKRFGFPQDSVLLIRLACDRHVS